MVIVYINISIIHLLHKLKFPTTMDSSTITKDITTTQLMANYNYLLIIRCKINKEYTGTNYIPSFITNKTVGYLVKNINDVKDIIKEIFLVWRYKYHSDTDKYIQSANFEYMEQIIQKLSDLTFLPYLDFRIDGGFKPFGDIDCWFRIYNMREEFINLLDLVDEKDKPKFDNLQNVVYRVIPYIIYSEPNPNRLRIHISNPDSITKSINQICQIAKNTYDLDYYTALFNKLGLKIKNKVKFIKNLNSGSSFLLTKEDFDSECPILYSNVYFSSSG